MKFYFRSYLFCSASSTLLGLLSTINFCLFELNECVGAEELLWPTFSWQTFARFSRFVDKVCSKQSEWKRQLRLAAKAACAQLFLALRFLAFNASFFFSFSLFCFFSPMKTLLAYEDGSEQRLFYHGQTNDSANNKKRDKELKGSLDEKEKKKSGPRTEWTNLLSSSSSATSSSSSPELEAVCLKLCFLKQFAVFLTTNCFHSVVRRRNNEKFVVRGRDCF